MSIKNSPTDADIVDEWWCGTCEMVVDPIDVTHDERHDERSGGCGNHVGSKPAYRRNFDALLEAAEECLSRLDPRQENIFAKDLHAVIDHCKESGVE